MNGYHIIAEAEHDSDDALAKSVARILTEAYPGHPWHIAITGGVLVIKHMRMSNSMGMVLKYRDVAHDALRLKRGIVFAAGELLERAGLARGYAREVEIGDIEGIAFKHRVLQ